MGCRPRDAMEIVGDSVMQHTSAAWRNTRPPHDAWVLRAGFQHTCMDRLWPCRCAGSWFPREARDLVLVSDIQQKRNVLGRHFFWRPWRNAWRNAFFSSQNAFPEKNTSQNADHNFDFFFKNQIMMHNTTKIQKVRVLAIIIVVYLKWASGDLHFWTYIAKRLPRKIYIAKRLPQFSFFFQKSSYDAKRY